MLKKILSISGKSGLYKLVSYGKNMLIVEGLSDGKRVPAYSHDKIISLGDIAIYTYNEEVALSSVMQTIYDKNEGKAVDAKQYSDKKSLFAYFEEILPDFDQERVYPNDIKKVITWYNLLVGAGFTSFKEEEEEATEAAE
ncbi:MAG: DUF5606 domain-containing protein [Muribaculaceae bacterium]|jgi:hypothetical protein|nr:DUF5606 domain-containing protein [Muribaculaceae bacterium]